MRVAIISSEKLPVPPVRGGAVQTYIAAVAPLLARKHEVTVFSVPDDRLPPEESVEGVRYVRVPCTPNDLESFLQALLPRLREETFDLIEVFNRPLFVLPIHYTCPQSALVLSLHNDMFRETKIPAELAALTIDVLDRVVTVSNYIGHTVRIRYPRIASKLVTVYSGVDLQRFAPKGSPEAKAMTKKARRELRINSGPVILYVGRLSANKGPHVLLDALPIILERYPKAKLVMVGSHWYGVDEANDFVLSLQQKAKALSDHVFFTGHVAYDRVPQYFALADVFVCASQWAEPLARVHYEAMAAGLPIVTTDRGGNAEVVETGVNGIVVEQWNQPQALADALLYLLDHPKEAAKMGSRNRKLAEKRFGWARVAKELSGVFDAAAELRKKRPAKLQLPGMDRGILQARDAQASALLRQSLDPYAETLRKIRRRTGYVLGLMEKGRPGADNSSGAERKTWSWLSW